jgi:cellulose biosynthesis protein BcsQ
MEFLDQLGQSIFGKFNSAAALFIVSIAGAVLWVLGRYLLRLLYQAWCFVQSRTRALRAVARVVSTDGAREGNGVWLTKPIHQPDDYKRNVRRSKILSIANLKGGVGKTTLAANIGAYVAKDWQKRVLLIDLDFQGSLSSMAFAGKDWLGGRKSSLAAKLISGDIRPDLLADVAQEVSLHSEQPTRGSLKVITAYYDLAQADNRLMVEWLLQCKHRWPGSWHLALKEIIAGKLFRMQDIRYSLAEILHSESVQDAFDLIIIDCPPRLTTSEIQAFCASSHLLVPTIFDRTSAEAVLSLCEQVETLKSAGICPHLQYLGIVGTMWNSAHSIQPQTRALIEKLIQDSKIGVSLLPSSRYVPHTTKLVKNADDGIAYLVMPQWQDRIEIRSAIANLAEHVSNQMGIPRPAHYREAAE